MSGVDVFKVVGVPPAVAAVLEGLVRDGSLDVEDVVAAARPKSSPLHTYFEWDDTAAAAAWRRDQAATLIRRVRVEVTQEPAKTIRVRAYVANQDLPASDEGSVKPGTYTTIQGVVAGGTSYEESMRDSIRRSLLRLQVKYDSSALFFEVAREVFNEGS